MKPRKFKIQNLQYLIEQICLINIGNTIFYYIEAKKAARDKKKGLNIVEYYKEETPLLRFIVLIVTKKG